MHSIIDRLLKNAVSATQVVFKRPVQIVCGLLLSTPLLAMDKHMDAMPLAGLNVQQLEQRWLGNDQQQAWELDAWYGNDLQRGVLKSKGERDAGGPVESNETQLLFRRMASEFFDWQAGLRYDDQPGPTRTYAVLGLKGLAPQWIELDSNLFFSDQGDSSVRVEAEYELLLTQRWVLQPKIEYDLALSDDRDSGVGAGGSVLESGLRLHYRVTPQFSPYLGYQWQKAYGRNADWLRAEGEEDEQSAWVAGVSFWF